MTELMRWGAKPFRTIRPRDGEVDESAAGSDLFVPLVYVQRDATKGATPASGELRCAECGFFGIHLIGVVEIIRRDYRFVSRADLWVSVARSEFPSLSYPENQLDVRAGSILLEFNCELGHLFAVEFGSHKATTRAAVAIWPAEPAVENGLADL